MTANKTDTTSNVEPTASAAATPSVGQLLRDTREQTGAEVAEVARVLRISQRYLEALEEGRDADLPGSTYAIGFVRSYAEHLKLDGAEIVRRYKAEVEGVDVKNDLIFPKPIPDSGVPGAAVLGLGVLVAALAYGVWYWNTNGDDVNMVRVEPVPEHLAAPAQEAAPLIESAPEVAAPEVAAPEAVIVEQAVEEAVAAEVAEVAEAEDAVAEVVAEAANVEEPQSVEETGAVVEQAVAAPQAVVEPVVEVVPAVEPTVEPVVEAVAEAVAEPAAQEPAAQEPSAAAPAAHEPAVAAAGEQGPSRITVRAKSNSWIQIRDEALDRLLFTRLLRAGDEYEVPNRTGLRLMTGNAGALELLVDGKAIPAIGAVGEVRRNVEMDPDKLKSGTAVTN